MRETATRVLARNLSRKLAGRRKTAYTGELSLAGGSAWKLSRGRKTAFMRKFFSFTGGSAGKLTRGLETALATRAFTLKLAWKLPRKFSRRWEGVSLSFKLSSHFI